MKLLLHSLSLTVCPSLQLPIALELHVLAAGGLTKYQVSPLLIAKGAHHQRLTCSAQVAIGMAILAMVYTMIIFNLIHHTIAALMGSFVALGK